MKIAFLGDIAFFAWGMLCKDWRKELEPVATWLSQFDYVVANLETPITDKETTYVCKGIHLKSDDRVVELLKYLHVNCVCLANNHICDYGIKGLEDTVRTLEQEGIAYFGVNKKSFLLEKMGEKIRFHGFCCYSTNGAKYIRGKKKKGVCTLSKEAIKRELIKDKEEGAFSVLSLHWGDEYSSYPNERQVELFHELAQEYDFLIHGHHAHVMQGMEKEKDSIAVYNQGNFYFDECHSLINKKLVIKQGEKNRESFVFWTEFEKGKMMESGTQGIQYEDEKLKIVDNTSKIEALSKEIVNCRSSLYKQMAKNSISEQRASNCVKHDVKWLLSKMNYYSIGAYLISYVNDYRYKKSY